MSKKRKKIPKMLKEIVYSRQDGRCAACIELGKFYHHVKPVALDGKNSFTNIVLLCEEHHQLLHLGDLQTCLTILEYVYYIHNNKLLDNLDDLINFSEYIMKEEDFMIIEEVKEE